MKVSDMDIKEIREALDKLDKEKTYSDAFVGACLSCYLSSEEQSEAINKAKQEYENNKVSSDLHASFPSYCRFLLSEVERLEKENAALRAAINTREETEDEFKERINGVSWNGDE